ncbi:MAG: DUF1003 domain-containing protein [Chitinophagales bacterium]
MQEKSKRPKSTFVSDISGVEFPIAEKVSGGFVRETILRYIQQKHPQFKKDQCMSMSELNGFREQYISDYLRKETGELSTLEKTVVDALADRSIISDKLADKDETKSTMGQRVADKVAAFGGSWTFILLFGVFLMGWIAVNAFWYHNKGWDPYPFILLNLMLSCIAAMQAPVIMMSQNRQEEKDRERARNDYMVNLKSELEIRMLHEKIDHLIMHQQQELLEIQRIQMEMMEEIMENVQNKK